MHWKSSHRFMYRISPTFYFYITTSYFLLEGILMSLFFWLSSNIYFHCYSWMTESISCLLMGVNWPNWKMWGWACLLLVTFTYVDDVYVCFSKMCAAHNAQILLMCLIGSLEFFLYLTNCRLCLMAPWLSPIQLYTN